MSLTEEVVVGGEGEKSAKASMGDGNDGVKIVSITKSEGHRRRRRDLDGENDKETIEVTNEERTEGPVYPDAQGVSD